MGGRASRRKGAAGEREVEKLLTANGIKAKRTGWLQMELEGVPDVSLTEYPDDAHIEVKRCEKAAFKKWFRQAEEAAPDRLKLVFNRENGGEWMCYLRAEDLIPMLKLFLEKEASPLGKTTAEV